MLNSSFRGKDVSRLGFGLMRLPAPPDRPFDIDRAASEKLIDHAVSLGVNYFDTAYTYGGSEELAGAALSKYPRDSYFLATKCPPWMVNNEGDFERIFAEQQRRCKTDYFDFYLVHNLAKEGYRAAGNEEHFKSFIDIGMYDMLVKKKAEGCIRNIGFSFHGTLDILQKLIERFVWDFAYIQINYVDWAATAAKSQYEALCGKGIPVTVMEPLRGGTLATLNDEAASLLKSANPEASLASWGIRYAASLPGVLTVLSGMNALPQLEDNVATISSLQPVTDREKELLGKATEAYNKSGAIACTGCGYCMPCPQGVNIPAVFSVYNYTMVKKNRYPFDNGYSTLSESEKASGCVGCGLCAEKCPQHLDIPRHLEDIDKYAGLAV